MLLASAGADHSAATVGGNMARRDSGLRTCAHKCLCVVIGLIGTIHAAAAQDRFGVVLMHGKQSAPEQHGPLASAIAIAGFPVELPEMCWSDRRIYDRDYLACLDDIDPALGRLRARGRSERRHCRPQPRRQRRPRLWREKRRQRSSCARPRPSAGSSGDEAADRRRSRPSPQADCRRTRQRAARFADFNGSLAITVTATPASLSELLRLGLRPP